LFANSASKFFGSWEERRKKSVMVYLDPKVVAEARELGLNILKICENALKKAIKRLKGQKSKNNHKF
jgi:post-segregation antitoxin (ccd killing protein)